MNEFSDIEQVALEQSICKAVSELSVGRVVAVPTETVYGLAAAVNQAQAINEIFRLKERPFFDPLIVHLASVESVGTVAREFPKSAQSLAQAFWPGPLTIVLPKQQTLNSMICAGLDTVGVRVPNHAVTLEIIKRLGSPLAAPSANKFGKTSPTLARHVRSYWAEKELYVVDAGSSRIGIESTVVRCLDSAEKPLIQILRPGAITEEDLLRVLPDAKVEIVSSTASPGHVPFHYQPSVPLVLVSPKYLPLSSDRIAEIGEKLGIKGQNYVLLELPSESVLAARELYSRLHELSQLGADFIVLIFSDLMLSKEWIAIWDRVQRAISLSLCESASQTITAI